MHCFVVFESVIAYTCTGNDHFSPITDYCHHLLVILRVKLFFIAV